MHPGMHRTWEFSHCDGFDCPHCGAVYSVRYTQLPIRDSESAYCENCHRKMSQWHSTARPWYTLIARPERQHVSGELPREPHTVPHTIMQLWPNWTTCKQMCSRTSARCP